jgi:hypothetical protein
VAITMITWQNRLKIEIKHFHNAEPSNNFNYFDLVLYAMVSCDDVKSTFTTCNITVYKHFLRCIRYDTPLSGHKIHIGP